MTTRITSIGVREYNPGDHYLMITAIVDDWPVVMKAMLTPSHPGRYRIYWADSWDTVQTWVKEGWVEVVDYGPSTYGARDFLVNPDFIPGVSIEEIDREERELQDKALSWADRSPYRWLTPREKTLCAHAYNAHKTITKTWKRDEARATMETIDDFPKEKVLEALRAVVDEQTDVGRQTATDEELLEETYMTIARLEMKGTGS